MRASRPSCGCRRADPDSEIIDNVTVTPADQAAVDELLNLEDETLDGNGMATDRIDETDASNCIVLFSKDDFTIDLETETVVPSRVRHPSPPLSRRHRHRSICPALIP